ncbi:UPF0184 protein C9orf16 homolog isoform X1 [Chiloscyllium plagiosum]|uniref:UPF0184 protein C9orf16 homolog isoform X1 n=1 Tax=Chiloscyllium plagiosum TaxID=36176 RepID=UPI001CB836EB|nr:UPF0184 protein C9orf16 homolog isoform X1 [Chiloscyllium plagiosum]
MSGPNGEPSVPVGQQEEEEAADEEYVALNLMLDQINSCLDNLEEKNDVLNAKLRELLESNRQGFLGTWSRRTEMQLSFSRLAPVTLTGLERRFC